MSLARILAFLPTLTGCADDLVHKNPKNLDPTLAQISPNDAGIKNGTGNENCRDYDGDSYCDGNGPGYDCNDSNRLIYPGAPDPKYPNDRYDNDCDGEIDEDQSASGEDLGTQGRRQNPDAGPQPDVGCEDLDLDNFCVEDGDCNNSDRNVHPGAEELCDGLDNDCDQTIDEDFPVRFSDGDEDCDGIVEHRGGDICGEAVVPQEVVEWECPDGEVRGCGTCDYGVQNCDDDHWQDCDFPELSQEEIEACGCHEVVERFLNAGILFILDGSGSMEADYGNGLNRYEAAGLAINNILDHYENLADFGLLRFPSDWNCGVEPAQVPVGGDRDDMVPVYLDVKWGATPLAGALDEGTRALRNYQNNHPNNALIAIVLSDGEESCDGNPVVAINSMLNAGIQVYLVDASQENAVEEIAQQINNPQRVYDANNPDELNNAFDSILREISIRLDNHLEECDGADNDCDGRVDEGFQSFSYAGAAGTAGVGVCAIEERDCVGGRMEVVSAGVNPSNEICDDQDNDCDGATDECFRLKETCKPIDRNNACLYKARTGCSEDGAGIVCEIPEPSPEICNGLDDDCDQAIDEAIENQIFYTGPDGTLGVGACQAGIRSCFGGAFEMIQDEILPELEIVDGEDNDCDGLIDLDSWLQVGAGSMHTCGIHTDNTVECWGSDNYGQSHPPQEFFSQISAGLWHTCGIKIDGAVLCWGRNHLGQSSPPGETFSQISAGQNHTCGVKTDQTVACWGDNGSGKATPPEGNFIQVDGGDDHTCGVKTDQTVACWGGGRFGVASPPPGGGSYFQISAGSSHNCGIKTDNTVTCWGDNADDRATPPAGTFSEISAGSEHTCGVMTDGAIACWGRNQFGQTDSPAGTFLHVSAGASHSCAVRIDNTITCWGNDADGQSTSP